MKRLSLLLVMICVILVGCGSKQSGDKEVYQEIKKSYISYLESFDKEYNETLMADYGLDKKDLDEVPLAIYKFEGNYVMVYDSKKGQEVVAYDKAEKRAITSASFDSSKLYDKVKNTEPIYIQNDFK